MEGNVDGVWRMLRIAEKRMKLEIRDNIVALLDVPLDRPKKPKVNRLTN